MRHTAQDGTLTIFPEGRIDSLNASEFREEFEELISCYPDMELVLDAENLEYISSAGLRVLLRLQKDHGALRVTNAGPEVYAVFEVTGLASAMTVERALRFVSAEGLEQLGAGVHSIVYRLDDENVLKIVKDMSYEAIQKEMQVTKTALVSGIPTTIAYDVVRSEDGYGEVYEMLNAGVLSAAVMAEPERRDEYLRRFASTYRDVHAIEVSETDFEDVRQNYLDALDELGAYVSKDELAQLKRLVDAIPERHTFVHGDYHMNNVMLQDDELLLIDIGEAGFGHPLYDYAQTAWAYYAATEYSPQKCETITGMSMDEARYVRDGLFGAYFGETGERLERKETAIHAMALLRMVLIRFLQGWKEQADFSRRLEIVRAELLPRIDEICELIATEFCA